LAELSYINKTAQIQAETSSERLLKVTCVVDMDLKPDD